MASIASSSRTAASLVASSSRLPRLPISAWILSTAAALPSTYAPSSGSWYAPLLPAIERLGELFPPILMAVPKHKVTHSRKSMRSANKGLHNKSNFSHCEACGSVKLAHNVCPNCYSQISRRWKKEARGDIRSSLHLPSGSDGPSAPTEST